MATIMIFHEVNDGKVWSKAWKKGPGSRHEMFSQFGFKARTFEDPQNPNFKGLLVDVPDMSKFQSVLDSDEGKRAMAEDGLKPETIRMLSEYTP